MIVLLFQNLKYLDYHPTRYNECDILHIHLDQDLKISDLSASNRLFSLTDQSIEASEV